MRLKTTLAAAGLTGLLLGAAGAAQADVYYLDVDGCAGGCGLTDYGTVSVTPNAQSTSLHIDIHLADGVFFAMGDNGLDAAAFSIAGAPNITTTNVSPSFSAPSPTAASGKAEGPFSFFYYRVDWKSGATTPANDLQFDVQKGGDPLSLSSTAAVAGVPLYFAVDIMTTVGGQAYKGVVGASTIAPPPPKTVSAAPEPAVWALMIAGFAGAGLGLRRRRNAFTA